MHKRPDQRIPRAADVVERLRRWTADADAATWKQLGEYAKAPGAVSLSGAGIADTISVHDETFSARHATPDGGDSDWPSPPPGVAWTPPGSLGSGEFPELPPRQPEAPFEFAGLGGVQLVLLAAGVSAALTAAVMVVWSL
jgi:hypothetical protein